MDHISGLEKLRYQMIEELTQIPQYRALKLLEQFMRELASIYEEPPVITKEDGLSSERKHTQAIDKLMRTDSPLIVKNGTQTSVHRVA